MPRDFRVYVGFSKHRKRLALKNRLGHAGPLALLDLWEFATAHRPRGTLDYLTDRDVEREAGWEGSPGEFVAALLDLKWATRSAQNWLVLHGWKEKQPHAYKIEELAEKARLAGKVSATKRSTDRSTTRSTKRSTGRSPFTSYPLPSTPTATSTSTDTTTEKPLHQPKADGPSGFIRFWSLYPRKEGRTPALKVWTKDGLEPRTEEICLSVEAHKKTEQWQTPKFIPHPTTFLNQRRYEDSVQPDNGKWIPGESGIIQGVMRTLYGGKRE